MSPGAMEVLQALAYGMIAVFLVGFTISKFRENWNPYLLAVFFILAAYATGQLLRYLFLESSLL